MGLVDEDNLKYMLVGAYRVPKCLLTMGDVPEEAEGMDRLDKDDPLEPDDDLADISPSEPEPEEDDEGIKRPGGDPIVIQPGGDPVVIQPGGDPVVIQPGGVLCF